ncbi:TorA maturation chaperone TorD [Breoghania corrubedonensis]|uniref:TorA maturation chaperone TorD n=1 Tax=Breoghania corrubedonensis TaxID=665038 RepID=A0A2T5VAR4_9HYPH|nr:molecular chaperone TorD family protein [Breoghania corrubedonensis]PTW60834.1 TorA maturation chaperone TorD [Breoghania corrubedonensis]
MTATTARADVDGASGALAFASEEDALRARFYGLIANLLAAPPDAAMLAELAHLEGDESDLGRPLGTLAAAARETVPQAVAGEFHDLFIGVGRGELLPYASYYLTGFLNEKPLARLRGAMRALGIERGPSVKEPEDHIAAIFDMMAGLISGRFGQPAELATQKAFFTAHLADWGPYFFRDLEKASAARFYAPLGALGGTFIAIEQAAFGMVE